MATLARTGIAVLDATAVRKGLRTTLVSLAVIAFIGVTGGIVYNKRGQFRFAPTVAKELTQQSERRSDTGDQPTALAASRKATEVYRRLMRLDGWHYAPYLAASLHVLSERLSEAGDNAGALAAIDEAIRIRRLLAKHSPARYLARLEQSVQLRSLIEATARGDGSAMTTAVNLDR